LVLHYLNDILCKNYNYTFVFAKVIPKTLLVPFFSGHGVYISNFHMQDSMEIGSILIFNCYKLMCLKWGGKFCDWYVQNFQSASEIILKTDLNLPEIITKNQQWCFWSTVWNYNQPWLPCKWFHCFCCWWFCCYICANEYL